jgi:hypothetical protein
MIDHLVHVEKSNRNSSAAFLVSAFIFARHILILFLEIPLSLTPNLTRKTSVDESKLINKTIQPLPLKPRSKLFSSLSSSITSLNSFSSRSRASSTPSSPLSTSSSNASLSSNNSPPKPTRPSILNEDSLKTQESFLNRRKTISDKITIHKRDFPKEAKIKRLTMPIVTVEKSKLNLISPDQIRQTAKLG